MGAAKAKPAAEGATREGKAGKAENARAGEPASAGSQQSFNPLWHSMATAVVQRACVECAREQTDEMRGAVQTKLTVGPPDDIFEREADAVAGQVMRMPAGAHGQSSAFSTGAPPVIQREASSAATTPPGHSATFQTLKSPGSGSPLNESVRSRVEPVLGMDLSHVRVHSGEAAQTASKNLNARAFTHQHNIFLASGESASNLELMAHEATHVRQQTGMKAPGIQRRIVMRNLTPDMRDLGWLGQVQVGTTENLLVLSAEQVETYIRDIGSVHHEYDDIIVGTGEEFGFVASESYRRDLVISIIRNLHFVRTDLFFDNYQEFVQEVRKRALISLVMRASQGRTAGTSPTGYPRTCGTDPGPRVSDASQDYWIVHPSAGGESYWFELSSDGRNNAHEALRTLIFNHQSDPCLRTLMHCDYMISAQQYYVMAEAMGATEFNQAVRDGHINLEIRWNSYEAIVADTPTSAAAYQSLQTVELDSESEFIIGDHVIFFNHDAFDDMNQVHRNVRGNFSNWRLENAIVTDMDASGEFRFQGHGYFTPHRRSAFVGAMVGKMNELVDTAQSAIRAGNTYALGIGYNDGSRFDVVRGSSPSWQIYFHQGLGVEQNLPVSSMPLRHFTAADYPDPFVQHGASKIRVRRPIESRRESLGRNPPASPAPSPLPMPNTGPTVPAPSGGGGAARDPAPVVPGPVAPEPSAPVPTAPAPTAPVPNVPAPAPQPGGGTQQQPSQQQPAPQSPSQPTTCPFICSVPRLLGARTPHYGRGDDFNFLDFPSLSTSEWLRVAPFRWMPDGMLEFGMNNVLGLLAGSDGRDMVAHFRGGSGSTWTHGVGSTLNRDATYCPSVNTAVGSIETQLAAQMRTMRALGRVDCGAFSLSPVPSFHFGFGDSAALKAIIGGTQGLEVYLNGLRVRDPSSCLYDLDLQLVVLDDFGVDTSDLYWPALIKFWILQHERAGNKPFINRLLINRTIRV